MSDEDLITRVTIHDHKIALLERRSELDSQKISEIHDVVTKMKAAMEASPKCPSPGLCLELHNRVNTLWDAQSEAKGGWKVLVWLVGGSGLFGGALGAAATWLTQHLQRP
jgi:hypothetical protein